MDVMMEKATLMKQSLCALGQSPILPITTILKSFREEFVRHSQAGGTCPECGRTLAKFYRKGSNHH